MHIQFEAVRVDRTPVIINLFVFYSTCYIQSVKFYDTINAVIYYSK